MKTLNEIMEFDHVIRVHADGSITTEHRHGPNLHDGELDREGWTLMNGYSHQDRYPGPIMHSSEFIGGRMETDIRENPGVYVALVAYYTPDEDDVEGTGADEMEAEGWVVAKLDVR